MITLQELFEFNENDLRANRAGRLSPAQQARWHQRLNRVRRAQRGGAGIAVLVIGGMLLAGVKYAGVFGQDIPPEIIPWLIRAGILMMAFPVLAAIWGRLTMRRRFQHTEEEFANGQIKCLSGVLQLSRTFNFGLPDTYNTGYITTLSVNGQELRCSNEKITGGEEMGQALFAAFGLPQPPEQSDAEQWKRIPQVTEVPHGEYRIYCLPDGWEQLHVLSLELSAGL